MSGLCVSRRSKAMTFWAEEKCDCGHERAGHKDSIGNNAWTRLERSEQGVGGCFQVNCKCLEFTEFGEEIERMRQSESNCSK